MIAPPDDEGLPGLEACMEQLQANGGNYIRVWLGTKDLVLASARVQGLTL